MNRFSIFTLDTRAYLLILVLFLAGSGTAGQWDRHGHRIVIEDTDSVESDTIVTKSTDLKSVTEPGGSIFAAGSAGIGTVAFLNFGFGLIEKNYILLLEVENGITTGIAADIVKQVDSKNILFGRVFFNDPFVRVSGLAGIGFLKGKNDERTFYSTMSFPVMVECCFQVARHVGAGIGLKASLNRYTNYVGVLLCIKVNKTLM